MMNYYNDIIIKIFDDFSAVIDRYLMFLNTKSSGKKLWKVMSVVLLSQFRYNKLWQKTRNRHQFYRKSMISSLMTVYFSFVYRRYFRPTWRVSIDDSSIWRYLLLTIVILTPYLRKKNRKYDVRIFYLRSRKWYLLFDTTS